MASKLKTQEVILQSPNGLQEAILSLSDSGVVSSTKPLTLASPTITSPTITGTTTIAQENWIAPTLLNGWINYGGLYAPAGYMKDSLGFVHFRGFIKSGTIGQPVFSLPIGYRPQYNIISATPSNSTYGQVTIYASAATVNVDVGNNTWFSLDGITFKAEL